MAMKKRISGILGVGLTLALLTSLLLTAAPVAADVSQPTVTLAAFDTDNPKAIIRKLNIYTIVFDVFKTLPTTGTIKVKFPAGTGLKTSAAWDDDDISIEATAGFGTKITEDFVLDTATETRVTTEDTTVTISMGDLPNAIGEAARVKVKFYDGVTNPDDPGDYTLEINTSEETTFVESAIYTIKSPTLSGGIYVYNAEGIQMSFTSDLATAVAAVTAKDFTIEVGPGTYLLEDPLILTWEGTILKSIDGKDTTFIKSDTTADWVQIEDKGITVTGFTFKNKGVPLLKITDAAADDVVIDDNVFYTDSTALALDVTAAVEGLEITNNEFDLDDAGDLGIGGTTGTSVLTDVTISGNTFSGEGDKAINVSVELATKDSTISSNVITDIDSGIILTAVTGTAKTLTISDNTINGVGKTGITITALAAGTTSATDSQVTIIGNTIDYSSVNCIDVNTANVGNLAINWNNLLPKATKDALEATAKVNARFNWWGTTVTAEVEELIDATTLPDYKPVLDGLVASVTSGMKVDTNVTSLDAKTAASVKVSGVEDETTVALGGPYLASFISAAKYAANPEDALGGATAFYNVYVALQTDFDTDDVTIKLRFYDTAFNTGSVVYFWSGDYWSKCTTQEARDGLVWVNVTEDTSPAIDELKATPFAVVAGEAVAAVFGAPVILSPETGATDVRLKPTFVWSEVADADGYYFQLADNVNFVVPLVKLDGDLGRLIVTAYAYVTELPYSTLCYWRVKAVSGTVEAGDLAESAWRTGVFITMDEPAEAPPPPDDDFAIFLEVNGVDIRQLQAIVFDEAGRLLIGIRISDVKRRVVLESIAVEATLAGQRVASISESLEGDTIPVDGDDYEKTIALGEDEPLSFGLLGRTTGKFSGQITLTYSLPDGSSKELKVSKPIQIPGNPIGTAAGQAAAGMAVVSVIAASWLFTSAASSTIAASVSVPGNAVAELRSNLSDWVHKKLEDKARGGVRSLIMKTVNSRMPKNKCPWCDIPFENEYCSKCKKSAEQARREYAKHVNDLAEKAAGLIEDARRPITVQEIQSGLNIIGADKTAGDVLVALNNAGLIRLTGIGGRKLARWALGLGIIIGLDAVLWVTVGGWAALPTWALLATIGGSAVVPWAVTKALEVRGGRRPRAAG